MSRVYYSKTEQQAAEREAFVRMGWGIALFGLAVAVLAGGVTFILSELGEGRNESAGWAIVLTVLFVSTLGYFLKETVNPTIEANPDRNIR